MTDPDPAVNDLRSALVAGLRAGRDAERNILAALAPGERDAPAADGGWSAKDIQTHLSAWRQRQGDRMRARREGRDDPHAGVLETDEVNAVIHDERADWPWDRVVDDAEQTTDLLAEEIAAATKEALTDGRLVGSIMGDGPEHDLAHLPDLAARGDQDPVVARLAATIAGLLDRDVLPPRPAAFLRYNLACYHAKAGDLDAARALLRQALPGQAELRSLAPTDDDLVALRDEIPGLLAG